MTECGHIICEETSGEAFYCTNAETILTAAQRCGKRVIPVGCHNGGCGLCKIRVLEGEFRTGKMSRAHVSGAEEQDGYALACRTTPISALKIVACRQTGDIDGLSTGK